MIDFSHYPRGIAAKLENLLTKEKMESLLNVAQAMADGDRNFGATLLSAAAGYHDAGRPELPITILHGGAQVAYSMGLQVYGCQYPKCQASKAAAEKSADEVLKRAVGK